MNRIFKTLGRSFVPYSVGVRWKQRQVAKQHAELYKQMEDAPRAPQRNASDGYDYEGSISELVAWGLDPVQVREGSMPLASLEFCARTLADQLDTSRSLAGLHIGNFLGVSLCYFSRWLCRHNPESILISIDPNLSHRGIDNPQRYVSRLVRRYGLGRSNLLIAGFTLSENLPDDGRCYHEPRWPHSRDEFACENALPNLRKLGIKVDFAVVDGNHQEQYLLNELDHLIPMLGPGGMVVVDDVSEAWHGVRKAYQSVVATQPVEEIGRDGRVGILRKRH